jgi:hypothetical protein
MRIAITLLALLSVPACGEPTRRGDEHFGASAVRFSARLTGPPMGYQAGDFLQPGLENVARGGGGSRGNDRFRPETFRHLDLPAGFSLIRRRCSPGTSAHSAR